MIVAIEGMDGVGKTTICKFIESNFNFKYIEKPTKYLFIDEYGNINYKEFNDVLNKIYNSDKKIRSVFFGKGNYIAVNLYPNCDVVIDRHLASNYYWNGDKTLNEYYNKLIGICGKPDLTIYLHATPQIRTIRLKNRKLNDFDLNDPTILDNGLKKYIYFFKKFKFNYKIVYTDNKTIDEVCNEVHCILKKFKS